MGRPANPFLPKFDGIRWYKEAKGGACAKEECLRFLTDTVRCFVELWPGARIDVVPTAY